MVEARAAPAFDATTVRMTPIAAPPTTPQVAALFVHPLKGARALAVPALALDARGAVGDRRWMLVDADGVAVTQREAPRIALVEARPAGALDDAAAWARPTLVLRAPDGRSCLAHVPEAVPARPVRVWDDLVPAHDAGDEAAAWCSEAVGVPCRLVRLADAARRPLRAKYAGPLDPAGRHVALSDGAPLLLLGEASVEALNARLAARGEPPVPADRFRANVLLTGTAPHEEDGWRLLRIGEVGLGIGSPCPRCVVTTIDQATAAGGVEPLRTLAEYRRQDGKVMFGMNATHAAPGVLRVGDAVEVLERREGLGAG
jgi:uncharacterized protein YcbX